MTVQQIEQMISEAANKIAELQQQKAGLRDALRFYADPVAWKKEHDPEDDVQIPDFYSETSFGDTAKAALGAYD